MILRVEMLEDAAGRVRPYLVDAERDEVLPGQVACQVISQPGEQPSVTVTFAIDDREVQIVPSQQEGTEP